MSESQTRLFFLSATMEKRLESCHKLLSNDWLCQLDLILGTKKRNIIKMTVQDPRMHWAILSLMRVLSLWSEIAYLFLFCLESVLLTVDLATLSQHLSNYPHYRFPSINGLHWMLHEQKALWLIDTCSYTDNREPLLQDRELLQGRGCELHTVFQMVI